MNDNEKLYHSALSRCAEQLDNMRDGDPITDVPDFLAAKLKQCQLASAAKGGNTSAIDSWTGHEIMNDPSLDFVEFVKLSDAAYLASQSQAAQPSELTDEQIEDAVQGIYLSDYPESSGYDIAIARAAIAAYLAGQSQATRAVPIAWMRSNRKECTTAESKAWMENAGFGHWPSIAKEYTIPLYVAPTAQEVTQQAAKAETAEQAEGGQANRSSALRAEPAGQLGAVFRGTIDAGEYNRDTGMMRVTVKLPFKGLPEALLTINAPAFIVPADESDASRCRAQGGEDKPNSSDLAPTTSTVSAPGAPLPERDPSKPTEQQGLFRKFDVRRVDGSDQPGGKHYGCRYYVLDLTHDQHAPAAMRAYAADCAGTHPELAADIEAEFGAQPTLDEVRNQALEEAASLYIVGNVAAREIRALKAKITAPSSTDAGAQVAEEARNQALLEAAKLVEEKGEPSIARAVRALRTTSGKGEAA